MSSSSAVATRRKAARILITVSTATRVHIVGLLGENMPIFNDVLLLAEVARQQTNWATRSRLGSIYLRDCAACEAHTSADMASTCRTTHEPS